MSSNKTGVLLLNLGTPQSSSVKDVRSYLREFLSDPHVIQLPALLRAILVNFIIVPFRAAKSAAAYKKIWQTDGSPLLVNSRELQAGLQQNLGADYVVSLGMNYGQPTVAAALQMLQEAQVQNLKIIPLFPQYSMAATGSVLQKTLKLIKDVDIKVPIDVQQDFFANKYYIDALGSTVRPYISKDYDHLLLSYHGLPEQQMLHEHAFSCKMQGECPAINTGNVNCYRAQCYQTSRLLAQHLDLPTEKWSVSFQSRLGRIPWIKPYTDEVLVELSAKGVKKLLICCPSFVVDCLETLEEIGIRAREQWLELGGESLELIPCLNANSDWIEALGSFLKLNETNPITA